MRWVVEIVDENWFVVELITTVYCNKLISKGIPIQPSVILIRTDAINRKCGITIIRTFPSASCRKRKIKYKRSKYDCE